MEIRIDFEALTKIEAQLRRAPEIAPEELLIALTEADALVLREVKDRTPAAGGTLRASEIAVEKIEGLGVQGFVGSPLNYTAPVELGTRPHFPPVDALIDWVKTRFGITSETQARGVAFLVARKISRKGTEGAGMFESALAATEPQIRAMFEAAGGRIVARALGDGA